MRRNDKFEAERRNWQSTPGAAILWLPVLIAVLSLAGLILFFMPAGARSNPAMLLFAMTSVLGSWGICVAGFMRHLLRSVKILEDTLAGLQEGVPGQQPKTD